MNPLELIPGDEESVIRCWRIVYTRENREQSLARFLHRHSIPFYLPLNNRHPLFPRYLFMRASDDEVLTSLSSLCICRIVPVDDEEAFVKALQNLDGLLARTTRLRLEPPTSEGRPVKLLNGTPRAAHGRFVQENGQERFYLDVRPLHYAVSVDLADLGDVAIEARASAGRNPQSDA